MAIMEQEDVKDAEDSFLEQSAQKAGKEAKDVNVTVKASEEVQNDFARNAKKTTDILRAMHDEPWQRLDWIDSEVSLSSSPSCHEVLTIK